MPATLNARSATLEDFQDLVIRGADRALSRLGEQIESHLTKGWSRNKKRERDSERLFGENEGRFCVFERTKVRGAPSVGVALLCKTGVAEVANIVPLDKSELSIAEYNEALTYFATHFAAPAAQRLGLKVEITPPQRHLTDWLSQTAADTLVTFNAAANHSSAASHPMDQRRWLDFIIACHRDATPSEAGLLRRWLIECAGWSEDLASDLVSQYELGRELLKQYD